MRDHLLVGINIGNAHRSGASANVTIEEFKSHQLTADGSYIISVEKHKTFDTYGHAYITLELEKFKWLATFVTKIRSQISSNCRNIFISWSGLPMSSGAISMQLGSLWKKAGIFEVESGKRNVCATLFRNAASTGVRKFKIGDS